MEDVVCSVSESAAEGMVLTLVIVVTHPGSIDFYVSTLFPRKGVSVITLGDVDVDLGVGIAAVGLAVAVVQRVRLACVLNKPPCCGRYSKDAENCCLVDTALAKLVQSTRWTSRIMWYRAE